MHRALLFAAVLVASLLPGCSATVTGKAVRPPASAVERALGNSSELSRVLGLAVESDALPQVGGIAALRDDKEGSSPPACAGVAHAGWHGTYVGAPLRAVARGFWATPQGSDDRVNVVISVAELDSPSSAQAWYVRTAAQWGHCQGVTVTESTSAVSFIQYISRISDSDKALAAELTVSTDNGIMTPVLNRRAFIATSQYLIDAEVFGTTRDPDASHLDASAVAHLIAGKLG